MQLVKPNVHEVSLVDKPASGRPFAITKRDTHYSAPVEFAKIDADKRIVSGLAYFVGSPSNKDRQGDWADAESVAEMERSWRENGSEIWLQHREPAAGVEVIESKILQHPQMVGSSPMNKGDWLLTVRVDNDELWRMIKRQEIRGYSIAGSAKSKALQDAADVAERALQDAMALPEGDPRAVELIETATEDLRKIRAEIENEMKPVPLSEADEARLFKVLEDTRSLIRELGEDCPLSLLDAVETVAQAVLQEAA